MTRPALEVAEIYITNVCNFNCPDCNKFSNYNFSGSQQWKDYANQYQQWSQLIDLKTFSILGGEPMSNSDYLDWFQGIHRLWPNADGRMITNGSLLKPTNRKLYDFLKSTNGKCRLEISSHNKNTISSLLDMLHQWLTGPVATELIPKNPLDTPGFLDNCKNSYNRIRDTHWPELNTIDDWYNFPEAIRNECEQQHGFSPELLAETRRYSKLVDSNGVTVVIKPDTFFAPGPLIEDLASGTFRLHQSNVEKAHNVCLSKTCHHFNKGLLYKCGQVALFPEFNQQFNIQLTDEDRVLLGQYQPAKSTMTPEELQQFVTQLSNPIPQCKFCPENQDMKEIFAMRGNKVIFPKKEK